MFSELQLYKPKTTIRHLYNFTKLTISYSESTYPITPVEPLKPTL